MKKTHFGGFLYIASILIFFLSLSTLALEASAKGTNPIARFFFPQATRQVSTPYYIPPRQFRISSKTLQRKPVVKGVSITTSLVKPTTIDGSSPTSGSIKPRTQLSGSSDTTAFSITGWQVTEKEPDESAGGTSYAILGATTSALSQMTLTYCTNNWNDGCSSLSNQKTITSSEWLTNHHFTIRGLYYSYEPKQIFVSFTAFDQNGAAAEEPASGWDTFETPAYQRGDLIVSHIGTDRLNTDTSDPRYQINVAIKNIGAVQIGVQSSVLRLVVGTDASEITGCAVGACDHVGNIYNGTQVISSASFDTLGAGAEKSFMFGSNDEPIRLARGTAYTIKAIVDDNNVIQSPWNETDDTNNTLVSTLTPTGNEQTASEKITVCHKTGAGTYQELTIDKSGWESGHAKHAGDFIKTGEGACANLAPKPSPIGPLPPIQITPSGSNTSRDALIQKLQERIKQLEYRLSEVEKQVVTRAQDQETKVNQRLTSTLKGRLLLQVEQKGEVWFIGFDGKKYYLANGDTAYQILKAFGTGISEADFAKLTESTATQFGKDHAGQIFLRVQDHGQAYYVTKDGVAIYLKDGDAAYQAMKKYSLGATDSSINSIDTGTLASPSQ